VSRVFDDAICLRERDWSETSQTLVLLTASHGLVRGLAKGSRRERGPFSGGVELLACGIADFVIRNDDRMTPIYGWDLTETFPTLRRDLRAFVCAMYAADASARFAPEGEPHPEIYASLVALLRALGDHHPEGAQWSPEGFAGFLWSLLDSTGHRIELEQDALTGKPLPSDQPVLGYLPERGGFTANADLGRWKTRATTLDYLRRLHRSVSPKRLDVEEPDTPFRVTRLLIATIRELIGQELPSESLLNSVIFSQPER